MPVEQFVSCLSRSITYNTGTHALSNICLLALGCCMPLCLNNLGFDCEIQSSYLHSYITQNPQSMCIAILCYKYNATVAVVYYNPQSILVSFPMNIRVFSAVRFLT